MECKHLKFCRLRLIVHSSLGEPELHGGFFLSLRREQKSIYKNVPLMIMLFKWSIERCPGMISLWNEVIVNVDP